LGTAARPAVMPMDAGREGEEFIVEFDLPGIKNDSLELDIERNVVTVRAERLGINPGREMLATERPRGVLTPFRSGHRAPPDVEHSRSHVVLREVSRSWLVRDDGDELFVAPGSLQPTDALELRRSGRHDRT
jgi:hypothetical protein